MIIQSGKGLGRKTQAVLLGECKLVQPVCPAVWQLYQDFQGFSSLRAIPLLRAALQFNCSCLSIHSLCSQVCLSTGMVLGIGMQWEQNRTATPQFLSSCFYNFNQHGFSTLQFCWTEAPGSMCPQGCNGPGGSRGERTSLSCPSSRDPCAPLLMAPHPFPDSDPPAFFLQGHCDYT